MKVIFLDIDGVLNTRKYITWLFEVKKQPISGKRIPLDPDAVLNLNMLTMFPNTFIVVSSTWRFGENILSMQKILSDNGVRGQVYGLTPQYDIKHPPKHHEERGTEIQMWIDKHNAFSPELSVEPIESYVIIDDDTDMLPNQMEHFVHVDSHVGFGDSTAFKKALEILTKK